MASAALDLVEAGDADKLDVLLESGLDPDAGDASLLRLFVEQGADLNRRDPRGDTILDEAIKDKAPKDALDVIVSWPGLALSSEEQLRVVGAAQRVYGDESPEAKLVETVVRR